MQQTIMSQLPRVLGKVFPDGLEANPKHKKIVESWISEVGKPFFWFWNFSHVPPIMHYQGILTHQHVEDALKSAAEFPLEVRVLYSLAPNRANELSLVENEVVVATKRIDDNWYYGTNRTGGSGYFPIAYVKPLPRSSANASVGPPPAKRRQLTDLSYEPLFRASHGQKFEHMSYIPSLPSAQEPSTTITPGAWVRKCLQETGEVVFENLWNEEQISTCPSIIANKSGAIYLFDLNVLCKLAPPLFDVNRGNPVCLLSYFGGWGRLCPASDRN